MNWFRRKPKPVPERERRPGLNGEDYTCPVWHVTVWSFYGEPLTGAAEHTTLWYRVGAGKDVCENCVGSPEVLASEEWHRTAEREWLTKYLGQRQPRRGSTFNPNIPTHMNHGQPSDEPHR